jgi:hypothetical protein
MQPFCVLMRSEPMVRLDPHGVRAAVGVAAAPPPTCPRRTADTTRPSIDVPSDGDAANTHVGPSSVIASRWWVVVFVVCFDPRLPLALEHALTATMPSTATTASDERDDHDFLGSTNGRCRRLIAAADSRFLGGLDGTHDCGRFRAWTMSKGVWV